MWNKCGDDDYCILTLRLPVTRGIECVAMRSNTLASCMCLSRTACYIARSPRVSLLPCGSQQLCRGGAPNCDVLCKVARAVRPSREPAKRFLAVRFSSHFFLLLPDTSLVRCPLHRGLRHGRRCPAYMPTVMDRYVCRLVIR